MGKVKEQLMRDEQIGGDHYCRQDIQPWDIIDEYQLDFYLGNALKYILRDKYDRVEDIKKAQHYLNKWLSVNEEIVKESEPIDLTELQTVYCDEEYLDGLIKYYEENVWVH